MRGGDTRNTALMWAVRVSQGWESQENHLVYGDAVTQALLPWSSTRCWLCHCGDTYGGLRLNTQPHILKVALRNTQQVA